MINIGKVSAVTKVPAKTIRYYEQIGLTSPPKRTQNGYRCYDHSDINELNLIKGARDAGFSIEQCKELMGLFRDKERHSSEVKRLTIEKITQIKRKISALDDIVQSLETLSDKCRGDDEPECAILDGLLKK